MRCSPRFLFASFIASMACFLVTATFAAGTRSYISDNLTVPMYISASLSADVVAELPRTAEIQVISQDQIWSKVSYRNVSGWVQNRFLSIQPNTTVLLNSLKREFYKFRQRFINLEKEAEYLKGRKRYLEQKDQELRKENYLLLYERKKLRKMLADPLAAEQEKQQYRQQLEAMKIENALLRQVEDMGKRTRKSNWVGLLAFSAGISLAIGFFIGGWYSSQPQQP